MTRPSVMMITILILVGTLQLISASTIKGPPTAPQRHLQQVARLGEEVRLVCPVDGRPVPMIQWYRADTGQVIDWEWGPRYRANKRSLKIKEVDRTDAGILVCKAVNGFGKEEIEINLIVIDPKDFPGLPPGELPDVSPPRLSLETETAARRYERRPGEDLRIVCSASGRPEPELVWYKNGHELLENTRDRLGKSVLVLNSLMDRDEATYTCVARNLVGETRRDFDLSMEIAERTDLSGPANKTVTEGDSATFDCEVRSTEKPHIKWLKKLEAGDHGYDNDEEVISVDEDKYRLIHSSREISQQRPDTYLSQLELAGVTGHMSGMYICFVTNSRGTFTHKGAFLTVIPNSQSLTGDSPLVLILVISLSVMVVIILLAIIGCVVRRRHKDTSGPPETGEVCHNLMPGAGQAGGVSEHAQYKCVQPLPPPPTPTQWAHLYTSTPHYRAGSSQYLEGSGSGCNTYEVPHQLGYTHGHAQHPPSLASSTSHGLYSGDRGRHGIVYHKEVAAL